MDAIQASKHGPSVQDAYLALRRICEEGVSKADGLLQRRDLRRRGDAGAQRVNRPSKEALLEFGWTRLGERVMDMVRGYLFSKDVAVDRVEATVSEVLVRLVERFWGGGCGSERMRAPLGELLREGKTLDQWVLDQAWSLFRNWYGKQKRRERLAVAGAEQPPPPPLPSSPQAGRIVAQAERPLLAFGCMEQGALDLLDLRKNKARRDEAKRPPNAALLAQWPKNHGAYAEDVRLNQELWRRRLAGDTPSELAKDYGVSPQRISERVHSGSVQARLGGERACLARLCPEIVLDAVEIMVAAMKRMKAAKEGALA